jgi:signal transduction histidine kinase
MKLNPLIDWFIHPDHAATPQHLRKARLLVRACLLTSFFSTSYVLLCIVFSYQLGVYFTAFNVVGYFALPFLVRTRLSLTLLGHVYTALGAITVFVLTWFSGGMWSAIYPWIIAVPVLALLINGKTAALYWSVFSFLGMLGFGAFELQGISLPVEYNIALRTLWFLSVLPGLLLIIMVVSMTFESSMHRALLDVEAQKATIEKQSAELEKLLEDKDHIIGMLAHDLRNPLANMGVLARRGAAPRRSGCGR